MNVEHFGGKEVKISVDIEEHVAGVPSHLLSAAVATASVNVYIEGDM